MCIFINQRKKHEEEENHEKQIKQIIYKKTETKFNKLSSCSYCNEKTKTECTRLIFA